MIVIKTLNLTRKFKDMVAVDSVNLEIEEGECFGLLGPNGAGKTSLIRMVTGVSPPTSGDIWVLGNDLKTQAQQAKAAMGVVPQIDNLDPDLTVLQNLTTFARYFDIPREEARRRATEVLEMVQLEEKSRSPIRELSGGMKRRLLIARGLINRPRILVLDEPTIGLDPQAKYLIWHKLEELKSQGVTRLLCTQNMDEASTLCDRVAIMNQGKFLGLDVPARLVSRYAGDEIWEIEVAVGEKDKLVREMAGLGFEFEDVGGKIHVLHAEVHDVTGMLTAPQGRLRRRPATLEDVFFKLTGRSLTE